MFALLLRFSAILTFLASVVGSALVPENVNQSSTVKDAPIRPASNSWPSLQQLNDLAVAEGSGSDDASCYCDDLCSAYDDCCPFFAADFNRSSSAKAVQLPAEVVTCRDFRSQGAFEFTDPAGVYVVGRCPSSYGEEYVRESCERSETSSEPFLCLPVNGNASGILYGNYYCAVCNGEPEVLFWTAEMEDVSKERCEKRPRPLSLDNITEVLTKLRLVFVNPKDQRIRSCKLTPTQRCRGNGPEKCPESSKSAEYGYRYQPVELIRSQNVLLCEANSSEYPRSMNGWYSVKSKLKHSTCKVSGTGRLYPGLGEPFRPYSIIFDLNSKSIVANQPTTTNAVFQDCGWGSQYDPFAKVCRAFFCRPGLKLTGSGCVVLANDTSDWDLPLTERPNCSQMIRLNDTEFTMFSNDSVFVYRMGSSSFYGPGEYLHSPPFIYICSDFVGERRNGTANDVQMFQFDRVQGIVSFVGILISLIALSIQFVVYMTFPVLRNTPGRCVVCLVVSIFFGQLAFLFVAYTGPVCRFLAAFMHFAVLSSFCWMNVLAFDICRTFASKTVMSSRSGVGSKRFLLYSVYAWSVPATIVGICLVMDVLRVDVGFRPNYGEGVCWITSRTGLIAFFLVPVAIVLVGNLFLFAVTVFYLRRSAKLSERAVPEKSRSKGQLVLYAKLSVIMGLTWVFGFIGTLTQWTAMWYLFIGFNTMQGAFLCLTFVCTKNVLQLMKCRGRRLVAGRSLSSKNPTQETSCSPARDSSIRKA